MNMNWNIFFRIIICGLVGGLLGLPFGGGGGFIYGGIIVTIIAIGAWKISVFYDILKALQEMNRTQEQKEGDIPD